MNPPSLFPSLLPGMLDVFYFSDPALAEDAPLSEQ